MESLLADVTQSVRLMRKDPSFTAIAIAALALGIGANSAIFSVVDKVLLQPLPYPEPDRLMLLGEKYPYGAQYATSIPKYMAWRNNDVFSAMAIYDQGGPGLNLASNGRAVQIKGLHVSVDFFKVFGVRPFEGRTFSASEDLPGGPRVAVISESLWRSRFASDPRIVGKSIVLNSEAYSVVGIMPASYIAEPAAEIWIPLEADPASSNQASYLAVAARLKPGISVGQARAEMKLIGERFRRTHPHVMEKNESVAVTPARDAVVEDVRTALLVLAGAVFFVLLIACGNVANLLLSRGVSRQRELAIRAAVGASRWRIVRQLLTESVMLALLGGATGLLVGAWGVRALLLAVPGNIPRLQGADQSAFALLDWRIALFTVAVSLLTGIAFGLFPALHISNPDVSSMLKKTGIRLASGRRQNRVRKALVAAEVALSLVLLTSAALLIQTFRALSTSDPGIDPHGVMTLLTSLNGGRYSTTAKVDNLAVQVIRRMESLPGVTATSLSLGVPTETDIELSFNIAGKPPKGGQSFNGDEQYRFITPDYFAVFRVPLLRGRFFAATDGANSAKVVLINRSMANKYWPHENPIGQVITIGAGLGPEFKDAPQIIGVVADVRETGLDDKNLCVMYVPQSQVPDSLTRLMNDSFPLVWSIRSSLDGTSLRVAFERELHAVDGQMAISDFRSMEQILSASITRQHFNMLLLSLFGGIALLLAAIGTYGAMSYSVEQQKQELGIRMALGAGKRDIAGLVVGQGMTPALLGVGGGLVIAFGVTRLLASLLYGVKADDPVTFAVVAVVLLSVGFVAIFVPARRAISVDPAVAIREQG